MTTQRRLRPEESQEEYLARLRRQALEDEAAGRSVVMRDPQIQPKQPRKPSGER